MGTQIEYNDIVLNNVTTRKWDEEAVYDETGTDLICKKYALSFSGVIHRQSAMIATSEVWTKDNTRNHASIFSLENAIAQRLLTPRRKLAIRFTDGVAVTTAVEVFAPANTSTFVAGTDTDNGPKPQRVNVVPIGNQAFRVSFDIEATIDNCGKNRSRANLVLNNRWSTTETMDGDCYLTRRITGKLRIARGRTSSVAVGGPMFAKALTIPPLESSFKRDTINFSAEANGLACTYEVVDRQVHQSAPWPATTIQATHTESASHGTFYVSDMSVRLVGDPAVDKRLLIERAVQVLDARLLLTKIEDSKQFLIESFQITDHIGERSIVDASARVRRVVDGNTANDLQFIWYNMGRNLELPQLSNANGPIEGTAYDSQLSRVPKIYGYKADSFAVDWERSPAPTFLLQVYLQDPCDPTHAIAPGIGSQAESHPSDRGSESPRPSTTVNEYPEGHLPQATPSTYSEETASAMYTTSEVSTKYYARYMKLQLPIARVLGPNNASEASSKIVPLSRPQWVREHLMNLERVNAIPNIPHPAETYTVRGVTAHLAEWDFEVLTPIRSPDGSKAVNRLLVRYVYFLDRPLDLSQPIPVGKNPVVNFQDYDGTVMLATTGDMGTAESSNNGQLG